MPSGIINLTYHGTQDLFLTANPQITFFKSVNKRHTHFAIESTEQTFIGKKDFGQTMNLTLLKNGDLIHKMYLKIVLPQINLEKTNIDITTKINTTNVQLNDITVLNVAMKNYIKIIMEIIREINIAVTTKNRTLNEIYTYLSGKFFLSLIKDDLENSTQISLIEQKSIIQLQVSGYNLMSLYTYYQSKLDLTIEYMKTRIESLNDFLNNTNPASLPMNIFSLMQNIDVQQILYTIYQYYLSSTVSENDKLILLQKKMNDIIYYINILNSTVLTDKFNKEKLLTSLKDESYTERYKFAWVKQIGNAIIKNISIEIGSQNINKHTGEYLSIINELTQNYYNKIGYDKLIGNVDILTNFNDDLKPEYTLLIPLRFWFCENYASALPIINLNFSDIKIILELRTIEECCYTESSDISLFNMVKLYNIELKDVSLFTDYIYLTSEERKKFAQSSHEYVISQVQYNRFENITSLSYVCELIFNHPVKEIFWIVRKNKDLININGTNECKWTDFSYDKMNPITRARLDFSNYVRFGPFDDVYLNCVQPYGHHKSIPSIGVNNYNFSLFPEELQTSGCCNFSKIDSAKLNLIFNQKLIESVLSEPQQFDTQVGLVIDIFAVNVNILRFIQGMGGLAFAVV